MPSVCLVNSLDTSIESRPVPEHLKISAPSRLHFGLFSVGDLVEHKFGGAGLMIAQPRTVLSVAKSNQFQIEGPGHDACQQTIQHWFSQLPLSLRESLGANQFSDLGIRLVIEHVPQRHCGFGSGTQLAMATVSAISRLLDLPTFRPEEMAKLAGRGKRSAIGSHGFFRGGFLVDRGIGKTDSLAALDFHTEFPEHWPVVTVILKEDAGLSGQLERRAFGQLRATQPKEKEIVVEVARRLIIPGILKKDYDLFAEGVYDLGQKSGMMFSEIQNGIYNGPEIAALVSQIRELGIPAVGQSSWGPCVFAITRNDKEAKWMTDSLGSVYGDRAIIQITKADNRGAFANPVPSFAGETLPTNPNR